MTENHYDQPEFFEKYSQMARSREGLAGAGEWQTLKKLLPDFTDKTVLDLGCGYGWHCLYAAEHGAKKIVGIDLSEKMLAVARKQTAAENVSYQRGSIETFVAADDSIDIVLSSLALHYVADFAAVAARVQRCLNIGVFFIFSVEHPIFTAQGSQDWYYDQQGTIQHFPVDHYFIEGKRQANFLGAEITKYHKTLTTYLDGLLTNGFTIERIVEPMPPENMLNLPGMQDELRRPMMLIIRAGKN